MLEAPSTNIQSKLEAAGVSVSRYGFVVVLLLIGVLKFTPGEAAGIQPLVAHSQLMSGMYGFLSVQGVSNVIGVIEIATAALMALRPLSRKASFVGSLAAVVTFLLTVSFLFSTPGAFHFMYGFPVLGDAGQFLIKDLVQKLPGITQHRSEEHTSELQSHLNLVCRLLLDKKNHP